METGWVLQSDILACLFPAVTEWLSVFVITLSFLSLFPYHTLHVTPDLCYVSPTADCEIFEMYPLIWGQTYLGT